MRENEIKVASQSEETDLVTTMSFVIQVYQPEAGVSCRVERNFKLHETLFEARVDFVICESE